MTKPCRICHRPLSPSDLDPTEACIETTTCATAAKIYSYENTTKLIEENNRLRAFVNEFRTLMLSGEKLSDLVEANVFSLSENKTYAAARETTWRDLAAQGDTETLLVLFNLHETCMGKLGEILQAEKNKVKIKKELLERREKEKKDFNESVKKHDEKIKTRNLNLSAEGKAIKAFMATGMTEAVARQMVESAKKSLSKTEEKPETPNT